MPLFRRRPRTRIEIVAAADRARARGRIRKAVAGYREALAATPDDPSLNVKIAPLLARLGEGAEGARCFRRAVERHLGAILQQRLAGLREERARAMGLR